MKICVGLSGGVDSAVAAHILKSKGYDVLGVHMLLHGNDNDCRDAENVADYIGIDFEILDLRQYFESTVISDFVSEYVNGRTPNPCIVCNEKIKFGKLLDFALSKGCDKIATGHYAQIIDYNGSALLKHTGSNKDQTYFLYRLSRFQLEHALFPLAGLSKDEIRSIAKEIGFDVAEKKDSQEICFVSNDDYISFLESRNIISEPGYFVDVQGNVLGSHKGITNYTVGQRKGLGAFGKPMFVKSINTSENTVTLCENGGQYSTSLFCENVCGFDFFNDSDDMLLLAKVRYRAHPVPVTVKKKNGGLWVDFQNPERSVTPGQSCVFYNDEGLLIGGGIITKGI